MLHFFGVNLTIISSRKQRNEGALTYFNGKFAQNCQKIGRFLVKKLDKMLFSFQKI